MFYFLKQYSFNVIYHEEFIGTMKKNQKVTLTISK